LFFFSSRRRHTRWPRDWSSDVCSSDLSRPRSLWTSGDAHAQWTTEHRHPPKSTDCVGASGLLWYTTYYKTFCMSTWSGVIATARSEERRVGKECGSWWTEVFVKGQVGN